ncbi:hypothetical protein Hanom_Chr06g00485571 [Helianthus anomalus]
MILNMNCRKIHTFSSSPSSQSSMHSRRKKTFLTYKISTQKKMMKTSSKTHLHNFFLNLFSFFFF